VALGSSDVVVLSAVESEAAGASTDEVVSVDSVASTIFGAAFLALLLGADFSTSDDISADDETADAEAPISEREPGARANLLSLPIKLLMKVWVSSALMYPSALISNLSQALSKLALM